MNKVLNEGLDHLDFKGQILPIVSVDEYEAKSGDDDDIITFSFVVKGKAIGEDLCDWLIKGYDYISDCEVSEGELNANRFVVFDSLMPHTGVSQTDEKVRCLINLNYAV